MTGDYNALDGAILNSPDLSENAILGVFYDFVSGGDMPPHLADVILRRRLYFQCSVSRTPRVGDAVSPLHEQHFFDLHPAESRRVNIVVT